MKKEVRCPACHGEGGFYNPVIIYSPVLSEGEFIDCDLCDGTGVVSQKERMEYVRRFRE